MFLNQIDLIYIAFMDRFMNYYYKKSESPIFHLAISLT